MVFCNKGRRTGSDICNCTAAPIIVFQTGEAKSEPSAATRSNATPCIETSTCVCFRSSAAQTTSDPVGFIDRFSSIRVLGRPLGDGVDPACTVLLEPMVVTFPIVEQLQRRTVQQRL